MVIPFTGTFTPSSSFALPTNFGTNGWTGSITVDVASRRCRTPPRSSSSLTNTLTANCGPATASATIQKKVVSGPAVALAGEPARVRSRGRQDLLRHAAGAARPRRLRRPAGAPAARVHRRQVPCARATTRAARFQCSGHRRDRRARRDISILTTLGASVATPATGIRLRRRRRAHQHRRHALRRRPKFKVYDDLVAAADTSRSTPRASARSRCGDQFGAFEVVGHREHRSAASSTATRRRRRRSARRRAIRPARRATTRSWTWSSSTTARPARSRCRTRRAATPSASGDATGATNVGIVYTGPYALQADDHRRPAASTTAIASASPRPGPAGCQRDPEASRSPTAAACGRRSSSRCPARSRSRSATSSAACKLVEFTTKSGFHAALGGAPGPFDSPARCRWRRPARTAPATCRA